MMIKACLAQINPVMGDFKGNGAKIRDAVNEAQKAGARLIVFPELAVTGYPPEDLLFKSSFMKHCGETVLEIAESAGDITAIFGAPSLEDGRLYNSAFVCKNGGIEHVIHKSHLPNYGVFDEKRYFTPGATNAPVDLGGIKAAVTVCEDIWVKDGLPAEISAMPEVDLIINLSSSPFHIGKVEERRNIATDWAERFGKPLLYCNLVGGQDELIFDGGSFACNAGGGIIASAEEFREDMLMVELAGPGEPQPRNRVHPLAPYPSCVFEALKTGVNDYVGKNGFKKVLVALSGGIDSALTAHIAVSALGADRVEGIALPSKYSSEGSLTDARDLAENLGIRFSVIPITDLMEGFDRALAPRFEGAPPDVAEENIQARIRGTIMMAVSNKFGHLLLSTGNKSEVSVGYCTLYGDMAGGFSVLKDLPKLKVFELSRWINDQEGLPRIPVNTIEKPPSAELRPDQKDSDSLPEYNELDSILKLYVEDEKSIEEIIGLGYSEQVVSRIIRLVDLNEYKRRQAAPGIRVTPKAFGRDRRMPITNRFKEDFPKQP